MPKEIVTARTEGTRGTGRPWERWNNEVADDLKIMRIKKYHTVARDQNDELKKKSQDVSIRISCLRAKI
jgi:hypothetical protein